VSCGFIKNDSRSQRQVARLLGVREGQYRLFEWSELAAYRVRTHRHTLSRRNNEPAPDWKRQDMIDRYPRCDMTKAPILGFLLLTPKERLKRWKR